MVLLKSDNVPIPYIMIYHYIFSSTPYYARAVKFGRLVNMVFTYSSVQLQYQMFMTPLPNTKVIVTL